MSDHPASPARFIYLAACKIKDPELRDEYLDDTCGINTELRQQLNSLLDANFEGGATLAAEHSPLREVLEDLGHTSAGSRNSDQDGASPKSLRQSERGVGDATNDFKMDVAKHPVIGRYKLLEELGSGGMGAVYMAEQSAPVRRKVALKIIKPGMDSWEVITRFQAERQALAMMDHPNIARVLDAGTTDEGRPYFVMELVQGPPITEYCDRHKLSTQKRLGLFIKVCQAVEHAHQKGIIHRDLKPSNILVAQIDGQAIPKVIDFGVAKATTEKLTEETVFTQFSQMIGTPLYMSPEQMELGVVDVDTRSDVYSLGVLLYELLTGVTPIDSESCKKANFDEMRRLIRQVEASKPSARVSTLNAQLLSTVAERRDCQPAALSTSLRGELDWIVLKALEKDRNRRYQSPSSLAADIQRHLVGDMVQASPPSHWYRITKIAKRHKLLLLATVAVIASLISGIGVAIRQAQKAWSSEQVAMANLELAEQNAAQSEAMANFVLDGMIRTARPENARGKDPTLLQFLDQATSRVDEAFGNQPRLEAWVRNQLGHLLKQLGEHEAAEENLSKALVMWREIGGQEHPQTLFAADMLALTYSHQGKITEAMELAEETLQIRERVRGPKHLKTLYSLNTLGLVLMDQQRHQEAEVVMNKLLNLSREVGAEEPAWGAANNLSVIYLAQGKLELAEQQLRYILENTSDERGMDHPKTLDLMHNLAVSKAEAGNYQEAKSLHEKVLKERRRVLGEDHARTLMSLEALATIYVRLEEYPRAEAELEALLKQYREKFGRSSDTAGVLNALSLVYRNEGKLEESLAAAKESFEIFDDQLGSLAHNTLVALNSLAGTCRQLGRWEQAQRCYEDVIGRRQQILIGQPDDLSNLTSLGGTQCNLASLLRDRQDYESAVERYHDAIKSLELAVESSSLATARLFLAITHWGHGEALQYLGRNRESLEALELAKTFARSDKRRDRIEVSRLITLAALGQSEEAVNRLEALLPNREWEAAEWYSAASVYSIAGRSFSIKASEGGTSANKASDCYERAVQYLSKAADAGYFNHSGKINFLEADPNFAALHKRSDYTSLLSQLKK